MTGRAIDSHMANREEVRCYVCGGLVRVIDWGEEINGDTAIEVLDKLVHDAIMRGRITANTGRLVAGLVARG